MDAQLVFDALQSSGIEATINGAYLSGAVGELPTDATPSVWVIDEADVYRAKTVINELLEPESSVLRGEWFCGECGERCAATFQICWNCGAARPA